MGQGSGASGIDVVDAGRMGHPPQQFRPFLPSRREKTRPLLGCGHRSASSSFAKTRSN